MQKARNAVLMPIIILLLFSIYLHPQEKKALILQEMSWPDVKEYLAMGDMIIIPFGSTEQHGPHLPLGTDFYESFELAKLISQKTGVAVAPVLSAGISSYHMGFPGTITLTPTTMEAVLFETVESLLRHGFRKFLLLNYHGGNKIVQENLLHRINHYTKGIAVAIGIGGSLNNLSELDYFDWHAGISETSLMLYLMPEKVRLEKAGKPAITFSSDMQKLEEAGKDNKHLKDIWNSLFTTEVETDKKGSSAELSDNGIWCMENPGEKASADNGKKQAERFVNGAVELINAWKQIKTGAL